MPRLKLPVLGAVLKLRIVHPILCDELELPLDRGLVTGEEQAAIPSVRVVFGIGRRIIRIAEGNAAPVGLDRSVAPLQCIGCAPVR